MNSFFAKTNKSSFLNSSFQLFKPKRSKFITAAVIASGSLTLYSWNREHAAASIAYPTLAIFRHFQAILVVTRIVLDYQSTLKRLKGNNETEMNVQQEKSNLHLRSAKSLLRLFKDNGGVYIKLGQHISSLVYLIPMEYTSTMQELLDHCPSCTFQDAEMVFRQETGVEMKNMFDWVDPIPIGSASLASVYKGSFQGQLVAIKIQHYYLDKQASLDIHTCAVLGRIVKYLFPAFQFDWLVEEMAINLPKELDFKNERDNAEKCQQNFKDYSRVIIPKVLLATRRVLMMEFIEGGNVSDSAYLLDKGINPRDVSRRVSQVFLDMIFKFQFLHCDPHSGNLLVRPIKCCWFLDSSLIPSILKTIYKKIFWKSFELVLLDHGLYRELNASFIKDYANFWIALLNLNEKQLEKYAFQMFRHDQRTNGNQIDYHRLFASMVSGRSWDSLFQHNVFHASERHWITSTLGLSGIANPRTGNEKMTIQRKAGSSTFIAAIMLILQKCPRELLLVMKTNDLIRSIDLMLGGGQDQWHLIRNASLIGWSCLHHVKSHLSLTFDFKQGIVYNEDDVGKDEFKDYILLFLKLLILEALLLLPDMKKLRSYALFFLVKSQMLTYFYNGTNCTIESQRSLKQIIWNNLSTPGGYNLTFACNQVIQTHCQVIDMYPTGPKPFILTKNISAEEKEKVSLDPEEELTTTTTTTSTAISTYTTTMEEPEETDLPLNHYVSTTCFSAEEKEQSLNVLAKSDRPDFGHISNLLANETYLRMSLFLDKNCRIEYKATYLIADGSCSRFPGQQSVIFRVSGINGDVRMYRNDDCRGRPFKIEHYETKESECIFQGYDKVLLSDTYSQVGVYRGKEKYVDFFNRMYANAAHSFSGRGRKSFPLITIMFPILTIIVAI